jgi:hypothetical protein
LKYKGKANKLALTDHAAGGHVVGIVEKKKQLKEVHRAQ